MPSDRTFTGYLEIIGPTATSSNFALYQAGARFYSGAFGRFLSPDPLGPVVGDPRTLNPYSYAANNPMRYTDENGLCFGEAMVPCPENLSSSQISFISEALCCETPSDPYFLEGYDWARDYYQQMCIAYGGCYLNPHAGLTVLGLAGLGLVYIPEPFFPRFKAPAKIAPPKPASKQVGNPPNYGFLGQSSRQTLQPGTRIDRYGHETGGSRRLKEQASVPGLFRPTKRLHPIMSTK